MFLDVNRLVMRMKSLKRLMFLCLCSCVELMQQPMQAQGVVTALFVFGDSLLDTGNNNNLTTLAKASSPPYGNFPRGGRFADGLVTTDFIASMLGLPTPPPSMAVGESFLHGVNFASGGAGILDSTGDIEGQHIPMWRQIRNLEAIKQRLMQRVGSKATQEIISNAIYLVGAGGNDFLFGYSVIPRNPTYALLTPWQFEGLLVKTLTAQLKRIHELGGRKFVVSGVPILGCAPSQRRLYRSVDGSCVAFLQESSRSYNNKLFQALRDLQAQLSDSYFTLNNLYDSSLQIYKNAAAYGITVTEQECCGGRTALGICFIGVSVCKNPSTYYFYDGFHPTSKVHQLTSHMTFTGDLPIVGPWNLSALASL